VWAVNQYVLQAAQIVRDSGKFAGAELLGGVDLDIAGAVMCEFMKISPQKSFRPRELLLVYKDCQKAVFLVLSET
jgi:hypothetical protein